ncbi:hypothetical protein [Streptomyces sp. ITFR-6]|uniref:hypothetical protein n=1 Tax=Streptomyces sp. ITFR-6 TaxID=3075197 RepID=UPI00288A86AF|nr:hypothetical protein [Streptomyces sp. ITFR-6]WNI27677.1 hypothetical protein RLT59_01995 [Streptomyces sp. ITFR-6]
MHRSDLPGGRGMRRSIRNTIGLILAVIGAAAAIWAPFRSWYSGRLGHDFRVWELFTGAGVTNSGAGLFASMFLPLLVGAVLTLLGVVFRSRLLVLVAGVITLGFAILWMVRQGQAQGGLTVTGDSAGLGSGVGLALAGGLLMLIGSAIMGGRESRAVRHAGHEQRQEREAVHEEDRDRRGAETDRPYGMAARYQDTATGRAGNDNVTPAAGTAKQSAAGGTPQRFAREPQRPAPAPRGRPVPAREADSPDRGRGDTDRTQYEQNTEDGGSHRSDDDGSGRGDTRRG